MLAKAHCRKIALEDLGRSDLISVGGLHKRRLKKNRWFWTSPLSSVQTFDKTFIEIPDFPAKSKAVQKCTVNLSQFVKEKTKNHKFMFRHVFSKKIKKFMTEFHWWDTHVCFLTTELFFSCFPQNNLEIFFLFFTKKMVLKHNLKFYEHQNMIFWKIQIPLKVEKFIP